MVAGSNPVTPTDGKAWRSKTVGPFSFAVGRFVGFRFRFARVGIFGMIREHGTWRLRFRPKKRGRRHEPDGPSCVCVASLYDDFFSDADPQGVCMRLLRRSLEGRNGEAGSVRSRRATDVRTAPEKFRGESWMPGIALWGDNPSENDETLSGICPVTGQGLGERFPACIRIVSIRHILIRFQMVPRTCTDSWLSNEYYQYSHK